MSAEATEETPGQPAPGYCAVEVRRTTPADFAAIADLSRHAYPDDEAWTPEELQQHLDVFPAGQMVAVARDAGTVMGMSASLIVAWDDYDIQQSWRDFTAGGTFVNHDPAGRTLYGAEIMVHPAHRRRGVGSTLYAGRRRLVVELDLARIRFGALLTGYHRHEAEMSAQQYVDRVVSGELMDPTLTFQLRHGFRPLAVVPRYLRRGAHPRSRGNAVVMEWVNPAYSGR